MKDRLYIFDTTLRDGEQAPGATMTREEKVRIAKMLEKMRVDVIEAGFPASSPGDFEAVKAIADVVKTSKVAGLCRAHEKDIRIAADALKNAAHPRLHIFLATSPIHMEKKLCMTPDQVVERAVEAVKLGKTLVDDIEFSAEDAGRSEVDFLCRIFEAVIEAGATTINVPDTVGYTMPSQFAELIEELIRRVPNSSQAIWSVHCHNDLGLATANSLAAVSAGARQVECTINGLGERAGNAALEEVVMAVHTRQDYFDCNTQLDTTQIAPTSRLVSAITGFPVQPNKALVGANAFLHASGIHQDGILKDPSTYEIIHPETVGWTVNRLVLGKLSGRNALKTKLLELEIELSDSELDSVFARFKQLADKKREIYDDDLRALVAEGMHETQRDGFKIDQFEVHSETGKMPHAKITLVDDQGVAHTGASDGSGPVDAILKAINAIVKSPAELELFAVSNITNGTESQGEVTIRLRHKTHTVNGAGADTDIVVASAKAYLNALARLSQIMP